MISFRLPNVDVLVPNLSYIYVRKAAERHLLYQPGHLQRRETMSYEYGKDITDYINELSNDAEISGLYTDVNTRFDQLCSSNQKLGEFMKKINGAAALHGASGNGTGPNRQYRRGAVRTDSR